MLVLCPQCQGELVVSRDVWRYASGGGGHHATVESTCETCDGLGEVAALCSVCSGELDEAGDCPACQEYAVQYDEPYVRPRAFVPGDDAVLRTVAEPAAHETFTCALCGVTMRNTRTVMTVVSASRRATRELCAHCVRTIAEGAKAPGRVA